MSIMDRLHPLPRSTRKAVQGGFLGLILLGIASPAPAEVVFEDGFNSDSSNYTRSGRAYFNSGFVRLRGGAETAITSDAIYTEGTKNLSLSYTRDTFRLDTGEAFNVAVSVDGGPFTVVDSANDASGSTTVELPDVSSFVQLRFSVDASSFFEGTTLSNVVIEGDDGETGDDGCSGDSCDPPPTDARTTIIPDGSWDCGMPSGIPDPESGELLFRTTLATGDPRNVGQTPYGQRTVIPNEGGELTDTSNGLDGEILGGSLDFNLALPSGAVEHESRYRIRTGDGSLLYMRNCGVADGDDIRFVADFEAPNSSSYTWLHQGTYVGVREETSDGVRLSVYRNPSQGSSDEIVQTPSDSNLRQQSWACPNLPSSAQSGDQVLQARVNIGGFQSVGNSKYGSRRIIPITGGNFSGDIAGDVDPGGADYQLTVDGDLSLEARYTLTTNDGETIVVRNCGDFADGSLTLPIFETSTSGEYSWLNDEAFVGTIQPGLGSVTITVFERQ